MASKPKLGLFSLTMIVIGLVIGMGIFRTSRDAAAASLNPTIFFAAWIVGGLVAICGALTYAEIGSRYPITGGYYKVFSYAYHPSVAFAINCIILISNAASVSGVALIGSEYVCQLIYAEPPKVIIVLIAMAAIILFYGINMMGLKMSSRTQNILMLIKIAMLVMLISSLCFPSIYSTSPPPAVPLKDIGFWTIVLSFGVALKATSFTYGGYQQTINFGEEVENPKKNIPKGIFIGLLVIISLYLLASYAYFNVIGFEQLKEPNAPPIAAVIAGKMFGETGRNVASVLLFIAVLAYVNVSLLSNPRVMYAMSDDGILPSVFKRKDEKRDVLTVSLTVFSAICVIVLFFADTFDKILSFSIFLDSIGMATSAATIFLLRKRTKHLNGTGIFSMKLYPLLPVIFVLAYIFVGTIIAITNPEYALIGTGAFLVFFVLYFLIKCIGKQHK
jgi:APA family basic amino acid/polyamine antiporter